MAIIWYFETVIYYREVTFWGGKNILRPQYISCGKMVMYRSPEYQTSFDSNWLSVQEKKFKTDFQDRAVAAILDFLSERF